MDNGAGGGNGLYNLTGFHEPFSAISHLFGAVAFLGLGLVLLHRGRGNSNRLLFLGVYVAASVLLFSLSGVYHMMVRGGTAHDVIGRLDTAAIFLLIAGTFTPAHGLLFHGRLRWIPLTMIWTAAVAGIIVKTIFYNSVPEEVSLAFYLTMGWFGGFSAVLLARRHGIRFIQPLIWGGLVYSVGGAMDLLRWPELVPGVIQSHEVFHVAVLLGALCHWVFLWRIAPGNRFGARPAREHRFLYEQVGQ